MLWVLMKMLCFVNLVLMVYLTQTAHVWYEVQIIINVLFIQYQNVFEKHGNCYVIYTAIKSQTFHTFKKKKLTFISAGIWSWIQRLKCDYIKKINDIYHTFC